MPKWIVRQVTDTRQGVTKHIAPAPEGHNVPETPEARHQRLTRQKAANRVRVKAKSNYTWEVPSQRKGPDGTVVCRYIVRQYVDLGWTCTCKWSAGDGVFPGHGLYVPGENDIAECAHIAAVLEHIKRADADVARVTRLIIARMAAQAPATQETAAQAFRDLFGEAA